MDIMIQCGFSDPCCTAGSNIMGLGQEVFTTERSKYYVVTLLHVLLINCRIVFLCLILAGMSYLTLSIPPRVRLSNLPLCLGYLSVCLSVCLSVRQTHVSVCLCTPVSLRFCNYLQLLVQRSPESMLSSTPAKIRVFHLHVIPLSFPIEKRLRFCIRHVDFSLNRDWSLNIQFWHVEIWTLGATLCLFWLF